MSSFQSSLLYTFLLALAGYFLLPLFGESLNIQIVFSAGLFIGGLLIAVIANSSNAISNTAVNLPTTAPVVEGPTKTIYVGNLPYRANEAVIKELFEKYGYVHSVRLLKDRQTGKRRGFGFVEMDEVAGDKAISALNDAEFQQRTLKVREAKDRPEKDNEDELQTES